MNGHYAIGDVVLGNWTLVRQLGQGSFGKVYEAHREDFGVTYKAAIKIITIPYDKSEIYSIQAEGMSEDSIIEYYCSMISKIVQEFALMSRLKGTANIVSYEDHAVVKHVDGIGWDVIIRMELLEPMLVYINAHRMTRRDIIRMGIDVCKALELCQKYNIIHRDIKPENMFVSELGDFKLGDFGIARTVEKTTGGLSKKGTYTYMAPEVYREEAYGSSVDIYSLGIVMYRLLNYNRTPFLPLPPNDISHNDRELALIRRMSGEALPKPANAEGRLAEIVLKASAYNPKERYSSPLQMRQELEAILYAEHEEQIIYGKADSIDLKAEDYASVKSTHTQKDDPPSGDDTDRTWGTFEEHSRKENTTEGRNQAKSDPPKHKKSKRFIPVCLAVLSIFILLSAIAGILYFKSSDAAYQKAIALMEGGDYQAAIDAFYALGDYKDSAEKAAECAAALKEETAYQEAIALMEGGDYQAAIDAFYALGDYRESAEKAAECAAALKEETAYQEAIALMESGDYQAAIDAFYALGDYRESAAKAVECAAALKEETAYQEANALMESGDYQAAIDAFHALGDYRESAAKAVECAAALEEETAYQEAIALMESGSYQAAIDAFHALGDYWESAAKAAECAAALKKETAYRNAITLEENGEAAKAAIAFGKIENYKDARERSLALWNDVAKRDTISAAYHTLGLKSDGTVVAVGDNRSGQCNISDWKDIVAISAGSSHTAGLKSDGTVVVVGDNGNGQCNVSDWTDIVAISAGYLHTVGLKSDGTAVAVGANANGQCNVSDWTDIVAISAGDTHTVGLKADGTVMAVGANESGQCNVFDWTDIVAISARYKNTVGLKSDGTVVSAGDNILGQRSISDWTDFAAISAGTLCTVGLKSDGTVVTAGHNGYGQRQVFAWRDIAAISAGLYHNVGLKSDGTVVAVGNNRYGQCNISDWKDIKLPGNAGINGDADGTAPERPYTQTPSTQPTTQPAVTPTQPSTAPTQPTATPTESSVPSTQTNPTQNTGERPNGRYWVSTGNGTGYWVQGAAPQGAYWVSTANGTGYWVYPASPVTPTESSVPSTQPGPGHNPQEFPSEEPSTEPSVPSTQPEPGHNPQELPSD